MYLYSTSLFVVSLGIVIFLNSAPWSQQLWGVWGRATGFVTYLAFIIIMLSASITGIQGYGPTIRKAFEKLSYFITFYAVIQAAELDPINWSQKAIIATLGNINFMSSFLGLAAISMMSRVINEKIGFTGKLHYSFLSLVNLLLIWISGSIQGIAIFISGVTVSMVMYFRKNIGFQKAIIMLSVISSAGFVVFLGTAGLGPLRSLYQETVSFRIDYWSAAIRMTLANWKNGIGIDSYGDYYQQYRDTRAVASTGPQRVSN
jgi:hypothetical protein